MHLDKIISCHIGIVQALYLGAYKFCSEIKCLFFFCGYFTKLHAIEQAPQ
jgi:hypothetical protein